ncbi:hypothetical protein F5144DRAFT_401707 [Chaetomium tenue]|uniref:Uncharacterized protein n=1 Tax=Chaetomium tenue TaxID=1854479 RepID=A0ACB7NXP5_9PEZI|nr:hypothetical protein F5144DRAFT_401707 [Chaetomium globosum]
MHAAVLLTATTAAPQCPSPFPFGRAVAVTEQRRRGRVSDAGFHLINVGGDSEDLMCVLLLHAPFTALLVVMRPWSVNTDGLQMVAQEETCFQYAFMLPHASVPPCLPTYCGVKNPVCEVLRTHHMRIILTCRSTNTRASHVCFPGHRVPFSRGASRAPGGPDGPRQARDGEWLDGEMVQSLKWPPISPTLATRGPHGHAGIWIRPSGNHPGVWRNNGFCCFCLDWCVIVMGFVCLRCSWSSCLDRLR